MLIDGGLADTQATGNLLEGDAIAEMLHDNVAIDGRIQLVNTLVEGSQFFFESFRRRNGCVEVEEVEVLHSFLYLTATNHIQASVSYACKQISLGCLFPEIAMIVKKLGEDVVHHILALSIVVQKCGGQPIQLTVMLFEQLFEFTLICHTLLIHTKNELLNPKRQLFIFFLQIHQ